MVTGESEPVFDFPRQQCRPKQCQRYCFRECYITHMWQFAKPSLSALFHSNLILPFEFLFKHSTGTARQERVKKKMWSSYFSDFVSMNLFHGTAVKSAKETGLLRSPDNTNCCCSCILSDSSKMKIEMNRSTNETLFCFDFPNVTALFVFSVSNI